MLRNLVFLVLLSAGGSAASEEPDWDALSRARNTALECVSPASFAALFALASSGTYSGADPSEALSEANEDAFLRCPVKFLQALKQQPPSTRSTIIDFYFGIMHEPWELGAILGRLQHHPELGEWVTIDFAEYLRAKASFEN